MRQTVFRIIVFLVISASTDCVTFKIAPPPDPENQVASMVLCERVEQQEDLLNPKDVRTEFRVDNSPVHCFIRLENIIRTIRLKWKWYIPEGRLYRETEDVIVNTEQIYLKAVTAYDHIELSPEDPKIGHWTVVILINGKLIGRRTFQVVRN